MWLSGMEVTELSDDQSGFRTKVMKAVIDEVFYGIIEQLLEMGLIDVKLFC